MASMNEITGITEREASDMLADVIDDFEMDLKLATALLISGDCRGYL
jgi:hypothetical protein